MKTHPEKCTECKHEATPQTEEPCFTCIDADAFEITQEAYIQRIEDTFGKRAQRRRMCWGGRMCYCAPFEEKP